MIKTRFLGLACAALMMPGAAVAAGGGGHVEDVDFSFEGPFGTYDKYQLQRGFQVFHEVCAACHGIKFVAFRELGEHGGPEFPPEQVKAIAALYEVADLEGEPGDTRPGIPSDKFPANNAAGAPDLSLMAKARAGFHGPYGTGISQMINGIGGPEYIYSVLTGYTGEEVEMAGSILYENHAFPGGNISMAPPLVGEDVEYTVHGSGDGDHGEDDGHASDAYTAPPATLEQEAKDVAAFLMWTAEPHMVNRKEAGFRNLIWLIIVSVLLYYTNKSVWAAIKRKG
ncbi:cytochrome c1 [Rhodobacteraceae bacterium NNCM2]|nr:cytochrome c1 [Coraliihabitans acroporae]